MVAAGSGATDAKVPGREKNRISVTITHAGESITREYNVHTKIRKVIKDALKAFGIEPPPNATYYLVYGDRNLDDPTKSLADYEIPDGAELVLNVQTRAG